MEQGRLGFGIIGCGMIARWHAEAIRQISEAELVGATDENPAACAAFTARYQVRAYPSLPEMLADKRVEAICVCTPSGLHASQAIAAAEARRHLALEKPLAISLTEADQVIAACNKNQVKTAVISQYRFSEALLSVKKALDQQRLGKLLMGSAYMKYYRSREYYQNSSWRGTWRLDGGGALMNQGIHGVDLLLHLMGPVRSVCAYARTLLHPIEVEDTACAILEFDNGALGLIQGTTSVYPGYPRRIEICGGQGTIVLEEDRIAAWDVRNYACPCPGLLGPAMASGAGDPAGIGLQGHVAQLADLVRAVRTDSQPAVGLNDGRRAVELILAIYESELSGRKISLRGS